MMSTLLQVLSGATLLGLSRWLRTDLILAATLLFLVFASWALLVTCHPPVRHERLGRRAGNQPLDEPVRPASEESRQSLRAGRNLGTLGIVLGLLGSFTLLAICAW